MPSLRGCRTWVSAVHLLITSSSAIWRLVSPWAISSVTSSPSAERVRGRGGGRAPEVAQRARGRARPRQRLRDRRVHGQRTAAAHAAAKRLRPGWRAWRPRSARARRARPGQDAAMPPARPPPTRTAALCSGRACARPPRPTLQADRDTEPVLHPDGAPCSPAAAASPAHTALSQARRLGPTGRCNRPGIPRPRASANPPRAARRLPVVSLTPCEPTRQ